MVMERVGEGPGGRPGCMGERDENDEGNQRRGHGDIMKSGSNDRSDKPVADQFVSRVACHGGEL